MTTRGSSAGPELTWYAPGPGNPFGVTVLDCTPITRHYVATSSDQSVAEQFVSLRASDGRDLIDAPIVGSVRVRASLMLPYDGRTLEGVLFKADSMDVKWDIYLYDATFLFARSWTGTLVYRASADVSPAEIVIREIVCPDSDADLAPAHVYFLLGSHLMGRVVPHQVPRRLGLDPTAIAYWSFSQFGRLASYATFEDVTGIAIDPPPAP